MKRYTTQVTRSWAPTATTHAIRVQRPDGLAFQAGQHVAVQLETPDGPEDRFLSIASSPTRHHLEFVVRSSSSTFKQRFARLAPGHPIALVGPSGSFTLDLQRPALMISGGIGITPLRSMLEYIHDEARDLRTTLLYANRDEGEIAFKDDLDALVGCLPHAHVVYHVDVGEPPSPGLTLGRIDAAAIRREALRLGDPTYYVCGPPGMVQAMTDHLTHLDVPPARIRREDFLGY